MPDPASGMGMLYCADHLYILLLICFRKYSFTLNGVLDNQKIFLSFIMCSSRSAESKEEVSGRSLCVYCHGLNMSDLKCALGYKHQSTYTDLLQSSRSCNLCALISAAVDKTLQRWRQFSDYIDGSSGPVRLVARQDDWKSENQDKRGDTTVSSGSSQRQLAIIIGENVNRSHAFSSFGTKIEMFVTKGKGNVNWLLMTLANNIP